MTQICIDAQNGVLTRSGSELCLGIGRVSTRRRCRRSGCLAGHIAASRGRRSGLNREIARRTR